MLVTVLPDKFPCSWRATSLTELDKHGKPIRFFPVLPIRQALEHAYNTDAHFACAVLTQNGTPCTTSPRIKQHAYNTLDVAGWPVRFGVAAFDCDDPVAHEQNKLWEASGSTQRMDARPEWRASFASRYAALPENTRAALAWYESRAGYRLVCILPSWLSAAQYADFHARARAWFVARGILVDPTCKDPARLYRLPMVQRDGRTERRALSTRELERSLPAETVADILACEPLGGSRDSASPDDPYADPATNALTAKITENRNLVLTSLAGRLRSIGLEASEIRANLRAVNEQRCSPPLDVAEVDRIADSVGQYATREELRGSEANPARALPPEPLVDTDVRFLLGSDVEIANAVLAHFEPAGAPQTVYDRGGLWVYQPARGVWGNVNPEAVRNQVRLMDGEWIATGKTGNDGRPKVTRLRVSGNLPRNVESACYDLRSREGFFDAARPGFAFSNFFVTVQAGRVQVEPHRPENRVTAGSVWPYVPTVQPLRFLQFLHDIWNNQPDRMQRITFLQEFVGAALLGIATKYERAVMFTGDGANGKSRLVTMLSALFPDSVSTAIPPQLFDNEYRRAALARSRWNVIAELPQQELVGSEMAKAIISGDVTDGREIRQSPFKFRPVAAHLFCANKLMGVRDYTGGFWRKWVVLNFTRKFQGADADVNIAQSIIESDLSGIASWALEGAARLESRGGYQIPPSSDVALYQWRHRSDVVLRWVEETGLKPQDDAQISQSLLYQAFDAWISANGHQRVTSATFSERLQNAGFRQIAKRGIPHFFAKYSPISE